MEYTVLVLCFVYFINSGDSQETIAPTPALPMPSRLMSTDHLNPLKLNVPREPKVTFTGHDVLNPTPMLKQRQTTGIPGPGVSYVPMKQLSTTFVAEPILRPTPVVNLLTRLETGAESPKATNVPLNPQIMTTGVVKSDGIKPTPVILTVPTTAVGIPLVYDFQPEQRPSTGIVDRHFIEPSQVSMNVGTAMTTAYTSQSEQGPNQAPESINDEVIQNVAPCICKYSEENHVPGLGFISFNTGNSLTPPSLTPKGSKSNLDSTDPSNDFRQILPLFDAGFPADEPDKQLELVDTTRN